MSFGEHCLKLVILESGCENGCMYAMHCHHICGTVKLLELMRSTASFRQTLNTYLSCWAYGAESTDV